MNDIANMATPRQSVGSIVQALAILRYLGETGRPLGVTAIAKALDISPSSCFNILRTLVAEEMLEFRTTDKSYSLGVGVVELAHRALAKSKILSFVRHQMEFLADEFQITVALRQVSHGERLIVMATAECDADTQIQIRIGHRVPMLAGAGGRCIAAFGSLSPDEMKDRFQQLRWHITPDFDDYLAELEQVRRDGWAIDQNQFKAGVTTVAAPVFDEGGAVIYCLTGTMFTGQHGAQTLMRIGEAFREVGLRVSRDSQKASQPQSVDE